MGDRGNVVIIDHEGDGVSLYSHWGGSALVETVRTALDRQQRWDDPAYLARIVFCEMLRTGGEPPLGGELGFGISVYRGVDNGNHDDIVVDTRTCEVRIGKLKMSFQEFIERS